LAAALQASGGSISKRATDKELLFSKYSCFFCRLLAKPERLRDKAL
jgi:hypothetical protein